MRRIGAFRLSSTPVLIFTITIWKRWNASRRWCVRAQSTVPRAGLTDGKGTVVKSWDQERYHARPWREGDGTFSDDGRLARGRLRSSHHGSVFASDSEAFACGQKIHPGQF